MHRTQLDGLARALLKVETLDQLDAYVAAGLPNRPPQETPASASNGRRPSGERAAV